MIESVITAKSQTTLPSGVRKALGVGPGDRLAYVVEGNRAVIMKADADDAPDPVIDAFLALLERDMIARPESLEALTPRSDRAGADPRRGDGYRLGRTDRRRRCDLTRVRGQGLADCRPSALRRPVRAVDRGGRARQAKGSGSLPARREREASSCRPQADSGYHPSQSGLTGIPPGHDAGQAASPLVPSQVRRRDASVCSSATVRRPRSSSMSG